MHQIVSQSTSLNNGLARPPANPLPSSNPLQATPGEFSQIQMHPAFSNQNVPPGFFGPPLKRTQNSASHNEFTSIEPSDGPPASSHQSQSLSQSRAEFEASSSHQRSLSRAVSEDINLMSDGGFDDFSSNDEDYREFKAGLAKARNDVDAIRARNSAKQDQSSPQRGKKRSRGRGRGTNHTVARGGLRNATGPRGARGPRKAAEPTGDIKARLGQANEAFLKGDYQQARAVATEVIRINAETYEAWTTLASVFHELGQRDKAITALTYAASLRPKYVNGWLNCARVFLEETGRRRDKYLSSAMFCYSSALKVDSKNTEARLGKALIYIERNNPIGAISEYKKVLPRRPRDLDVIRNLCAAYYDHEEVEKARDLYKETFTQYMANPSNYEDKLWWPDLDSYIAIYQQLGQHEAGIIELKLISRWLLQRRGSETFWDGTNDDREWDGDDSRRVELSGFTVGAFPLSKYGAGLPLEIRMKLAISRLELGHHEEALRHFQWLGEDELSNYFDLFHLVADKLYDAKLFQHALRFYQPLKKIPEENTGDLYVQMGNCFLRDKLQVEAEECFQAAIQLDENNTEARLQLAKMYESLNEQEQAFIYVNEIMSIQRSQNTELVKPVKRHRRRQKVPMPLQVRSEEDQTIGQDSDEEDSAPVKQFACKRHRLADPKGKLEEEMTRTEQLQSQYYTLRSKRDEMKSDNPEATLVWMEAARDLTDDFRSVRSFYPYEKYVHFLGYKEKEARIQAEAPLDELSDMADRLSKYLGADIADKTQIPNMEVPADYRGIAFNSWLDIFLEFALCLARNGKMQESYEICEAVKDCCLFYHSREDMFLIHVCWITCALIACDEETCVTIARFFMRDYQFTTDSYRMFSAVTRMVHSPVSWYSSGPSQKYILRQIKAMDFTLSDEESRAKYFNERGSYSALDENGQLIINDDLDISLLMLYGHILYTGTSYIYALNYFLRALALDSENPMINLNVGLAYVHHALKRQAENRQYLVLQGLTFLFKYYNSRKISSRLEERQESHYNIARVYHMLGLTNLAIPYYKLVFKEIEGVGKVSSREDLVTDAAYNLQTIYAMSGNPDLANKITRKWLVI